MPWENVAIKIVHICNAFHRIFNLLEICESRFPIASIWNITRIILVFYNSDITRWFLRRDRKICLLYLYLFYRFLMNKKLSFYSKVSRYCAALLCFRRSVDRFNCALKFPDCFGGAARIALTDLALTRLYLDPWICIGRLSEVPESRSRGSASK